MTNARNQRRIDYDQSPLTRASTPLYRQVCESSPQQSRWTGCVPGSQCTPNLTRPMHDPDSNVKRDRNEQETNNEVKGK